MGEVVVPNPIMEEYTGATSESQLTNVKEESCANILGRCGLFNTSCSYIVLLWATFATAVFITVNVEDCISTKPQDSPRLTTARHSTIDLCMADTVNIVKPSGRGQEIYTIAITLQRVVTFLFGLYVGKLSDAKGRKMLMVGATFGYFLCGLISVVGWFTKMSWFYIIACIVIGFAAPMNPHAVAYISDISIPARATTNVGKLQAIGTFGLMFGFIFSVILFVAAGPTWKQPTYCFIAGTILAACGTIFLSVFLKESLVPEERTPVVCSETHPGHLLWVFKGSAYTYRYMLFWMMCAFQSAAGEVCFFSMIALRYELWRDPASMGLNILTFLVSLYLVGGICGFCLIGWVQKNIGVKKGIHYGLWAGIVTQFITALAPSGNSTVNTGCASYWIDGISWLAGAGIGGCAGPLIISVLIGQVGPKLKGKMSGTYRALEGLGKFLGSLCMGLILSAFISGGGYEGGTCYTSENGQWKALPFFIVYFILFFMQWAFFAFAELKAGDDPRYWDHTKGLEEQEGAGGKGDVEGQVTQDPRFDSAKDEGTAAGEEQKDTGEEQGI